MANGNLDRRAFMRRCLGAVVPAVAGGYVVPRAIVGEFLTSVNITPHPVMDADRLVSIMYELKDSYLNNAIWHMLPGVVVRKSDDED